MSDSNLMKEIVEMKSLLRPKITLRRTIIAVVVAGLAINYGKDGMSYLSTATGMVSQKLKSQVPIEFELERAAKMVDDLDEEIKANKTEVIEYAVEVERALRDLGAAEIVQREKIQDLQSHRANFKNGVYLVSARPAGELDARRELGRMLDGINITDKTVGLKRQVLDAKRKSLDAAIAQSEKMMSMKGELEVKIEKIKAELAHYRSTHLNEGPSFDESKVARIDNLLNELDARLVVAQQTGVTVSELVDIYKSRTGDPDVESRVDEYLAQHKSVETLADAR